MRNIDPAAPPPIRLGIAQLRPRKGRVRENLDAMASRIANAAGDTDLLIFPETVTSGYFVEGGVAEVAWSAEALAAGLGVPPDDAPDVIFGAYERSSAGVLHNSAIHLIPDTGDGNNGSPRWRILHLHRKIFLPTYGLFDEARFVKPGLDVFAYDTRFGRIGVLICEEMLHSLPPTILALDGAELIVALSASPAREYAPGQALPKSLEQWDVAGRAITLEHGVHLALAHLVGSEGGRVMPGGSAVYGPGGEILARAPLFEDADLAVDISIAAGRRARVRSPMLEDLRAFLPHMERALARVGRTDRSSVAGARRNEAADSAPGTLVPGDPSAGSHPEPRSASRPVMRPEPRVTPDDRSPLDLNLPLVEQVLLSFLRDEVVHRRGFENVVVGVSGGVDSAVTLALAVRAFGAERVHAFLLPYATSSEESIEHGHLVCETFGVTPREIPITPGVDAYIGAEEPEIDPRRRGNLAARFRALVLWDQSARLDALVLGTGNKSERLLGYFTWHADDSPPINPLGDLLKTQVLALAEHLGVPRVVARKRPSADLVRGVDDEDELGVSYADADPILHWLLAGVAPEGLVAAGFDSGVVARVHGLLSRSHWKRRPPTTALLTSTGIGDFYLRPVDY